MLLAIGCWSSRTIPAETAPQDTRYLGSFRATALSSVPSLPTWQHSCVPGEDDELAGELVGEPVFDVPSAPEEKPTCIEDGDAV